MYVRPVKNAFPGCVIRHFNPPSPLSATVQWYKPNPTLRAVSAFLLACIFWGISFIVAVGIERSANRASDENRSVVSVSACVCLAVPSCGVRVAAAAGWAWVKT